MKRNGNSTHAQHDYLIIGAGPAGLQLGYYLEKAGRDYLILEAGDAPGALRLYSELLSDQERVHGPDHPDTLNTLHHIGICSVRSGDSEAGCLWLRE